METTTNFPFIVDEQKLKNLIHFAVQSAVKDIVLKSKIEKPVQLKEASEFFSTTPKSLMKRVFTGEIPAYRLDGKRSPYYFNKSDIVEALKKGKIEVLHNTEY
jgi:hypothetical protein|tara:strand:+ start:209 stop:517 length:309 start_codon:yes stop_codon:yes gene_type:complete